MHALLELDLVAPFGDQAGGPEQHHQHDDDPVDAELVLRRIEVEPRVLDLGADRREAAEVQVREDHPADRDAPDRPHAAEDDHAEQEDRDVEVEVRGECARLEARVVRPRDPAEERPERVRPGLRPHQRDPHRGGRRLVLADRDPGAPETRVAQPHGAEDREEQQQEGDDVVPPLAVVGALEVVGEPDHAEQWEADRVDGRDAERPVREVEAPEAVAVADDLRDDLAESQRDDGEVVAAETERRQSDEDARQHRQEPGGDQHHPHRDVDPDLLVRHRGAEVELDLLEVLRCEPPGGVGADRVEGDIAEVEQAAVADDDVEPDGHHRERDHHDDGSRRRHEVTDQGKAGERVLQERVEQAKQDHGGREPHVRARTEAFRATRDTGHLMRPPASARRAAPAAGTRARRSGSRRRSSASSPRRERTT